PGPVIGLQARTRGKTKIELDFNAPGTDAQHPPPARSYLVKQSRRPIRNASDFAHAQTLCRGSCRFSVSQVGEKIAFTITKLRPHSTYYYLVAARDNVSNRLGPHSQVVKARTLLRPARSRARRNGLTS
ncbi:MAG: fibronectin type III domain-containing protein, partial [Actinomycetota bacterium]|nr:fibronectin type III domain-containing protein [Actinomycetota bacterium]